MKLWTRTAPDPGALADLGLVSGFEFENLMDGAGHWSGFLRKLEEARQAGSLPDVIELPCSWTAALAALGYLQPLDALHRREQFGRWCHVWTLQRCKATGPSGERSFYAVPFTLDVRALVLAQPEGEPEAPSLYWSFDEFVAWVERVMCERQGGRPYAAFAFVTGRHAYQDFWSFIQAAGGDIVSDEGRVTLAEPAVADAVSLCAGLALLGWAQINPLKTGTHEQLVGCLANGEVRMISARFSPIRNLPAAGIRIAAVCPPASLMRAGYVGGTNLVIVKHPDPEHDYGPAQELVTAAFSPEQNYAYTQRVGELPAHCEAWERLRRDPSVRDCLPAYDLTLTHAAGAGTVAARVPEVTEVLHEAVPAMWREVWRMREAVLSGRQPPPRDLQEAIACVRPVVERWLETAAQAIRARLGTMPRGWTEVVDLERAPPVDALRERFDVVLYARGRTGRAPNLYIRGQRGAPPAAEHLAPQEVRVAQALFCAPGRRVTPNDLLDVIDQHLDAPRAELMRRLEELKVVAPLRREVATMVGGQGVRTLRWKPWLQSAAAVLLAEADTGEPQWLAWQSADGEEPRGLPADERVLRRVAAVLAEQCRSASNPAGAARQLVEVGLREPGTALSFMTEVIVRLIGDVVTWHADHHNADAKRHLLTRYVASVRRSFRAAGCEDALPEMKAAGEYSFSSELSICVVD